jgi:transcriptional regulator
VLSVLFLTYVTLLQSLTIPFNSERPRATVDMIRSAVNRPSNHSGRKTNRCGATFDPISQGLSPVYLPAHFEERNPQVLLELMQASPLATLISQKGGELDANHIPLRTQLDAQGHFLLTGHVARSNPLWKCAGQAFLVVFHGPQAYVTPSWYPSKKVNGKVVPTWNYAVVHARGVLAVHDDDTWLAQFLPQITDEQEAQVQSHWKVSDAPADYLQQMRKAIVGISISVESIVGKFKVSQNRPEADREGVRAGMQAFNAQAANMVPPPKATK